MQTNYYFKFISIRISASKVKFCQKK